jgi:hypothetical protein
MAGRRLRLRQHEVVRRVAVQQALQLPARVSAFRTNTKHTQEMRRKVSPNNKSECWCLRKCIFGKSNAASIEKKKKRMKRDDEKR